MKIRRILVITAGEAPQVVTETLFTLLTDPDPWVPDELLLATTASGKDLFQNGGGRKHLPPLLGENGKLAELYRELGFASLPKVDFVLALDPSGTPHKDIRSGEEVSAFADALFARIGAITDAPDTELHLSIAGGRKTMSFIAGQIMSFCARRQDRLSHCLVEPPEAENGSFWWPSQSADAPDATIVLHYVDFLKIGAHLKVHKAFPVKGSWSQGVTKANDALAADELTVDFRTGQIRVGSEMVKPRRSDEFVIFALIAIATKRTEKLIGGTLCGSRERFWANYMRCQALGQLDEIYEGGGDWVAINPNRLQQRVETMLRLRLKADDDDTSKVWSSHWQTPMSHLRRTFAVGFSEAVRARILSKTRGKEQPWYTGFEPEKITLVLPEGVTEDFFGDT